MKANQLVLRCYCEYKDGVWQAFCLDFTLAVQGESPEEVIEKLEAMVCEYVADALVGEDREYAKDLIFRKAPLKYWLKYYAVRTWFGLHRAKHSLYRLFDLNMPLTPGRC